MAGEVVGFKPHQIHPWRELVTELILDFDSATLELAASYCKDKLPKNVYCKIENNKAFFDSLESIFGEDEMIPLLKNLMDKMSYHASQDCGSVPFSARISEYEVKLQHYKDNQSPAGRNLESETFVGRQNELCLLRESLFRPSETIVVVSITGMWGVGKSSLAISLCASEPSFNICVVDLRGECTINEAILAIVRELGRIVPTEYDPLLLQTELQSISNKTIIYLDNVDELLQPTTSTQQINTQRQDFQNIISEVSRLHNNKVKLLLTSRYSLLDEDDGVHESGRLCMGLGRCASELTLSGLPPSDCMLLMNKVTHQEVTVELESKFNAVIAKCGNHPLSLKIIAGYLQSGFTFDDVLTRLERLPGHIEFTRPLEQLFSSLSDKYQHILVQLSVFRTWFDIEAAAGVMGVHVVDAKFELHYLHCIHLVEADEWSSLSSAKVNLFSGTEKRYSLHTLSRAFLLQIRQRSSDLSQVYAAAEHNFSIYFWKWLEMVAKNGQENALNAFASIEKNHVHLDHTFSLMMRSGTVASLNTRKQFLKQYQVCMLWELFLEASRRIKLCQNLADRALQQGNQLGYCFYKIWEAELLVVQASYGKARQILEKPGSIIKKLDAHSDGVKLTKAMWHYVQGRVYSCLKQPQKALNETNTALKLCQAVNRTFAFTARVLNHRGHVYHMMGKTADSLMAHLDAYKILLSKNGSHLQLDAPTYLMNIGTAYHAMGVDVMKLSPSEARQHFVRSKEYYDKSLDIEEKLHMNGFTKTALTLKNKSMVLCHMKEYEEGLNMAKQALNIRQRYLPQNHPDISKALIYVGQIYYDMGRDKGKKDDKSGSMADFEEAENYYEEAATMEMKGSADSGFPTSDFPFLRKEYLDVMQRLKKTDQYQKVSKLFMDFDKKRSKKEHQEAKTVKDSDSDSSNNSATSSSSSASPSCDREQSTSSSDEETQEHVFKLAECHDNSGDLPTNEDTETEKGSENMWGCYLS